MPVNMLESFQGGSVASEQNPFDATTGFALYDNWKDWKDWADFTWDEGADDGRGVDTAATAQSQGTSPLASSVFDFALPGGQGLRTLSPSTSLTGSSPYPTPQSMVDLARIASEPAYSNLSPSAQSDLPSIAEESPQSWISSPLEAFGSSVLPKPPAAGMLPSKKRKPEPLSTEGGSDGVGPKRSRRRNMHSKVEQRYRAKLNDKFAALRDCIPDLRADGAANDDSDDEEETGAVGANKVNRGTILEKAREHILRLEAEKKALADEKRDLAKQLAQVRRAAAAVLANQSSVSGVKESLGRLAMAAFAGMMATESFHTTDQADGRALFALPSQLLAQLGAGIQRVLPLGGAASTQGLGQAIRGLLLLLVVAYLILPAVFGSISSSRFASGSSKTRASLASAPAIAASRRQAFESASQRVWIPADSVAAEWVAIALKLVRLSLRRLTGAAEDPAWLRYRHLASVPRETEAARIKAWDLALDAQLLGGDVRINGRRLLLTLLGGATLPETPARRMLLALHARILAVSGMNSCMVLGLARGRVDSFARYCWQRAQALSKMAPGPQPRSDGPGGGGDDGGEALPPHLRRFLELDVDDALAPGVVQRVFDMAWQRQASGSAADVVAVRSPLDVAAALWAAPAVRDLLTSFLREDGDGPDEEGAPRLSDRVERILTIAPPGSAVHAYATVARAVVASDRDRLASCGAALRLLGPPAPQEERDAGPTAAAVRTSPSESGTRRSALEADLSLALRAAIAGALLRPGPRHSPEASQAAVDALEAHLDGLSEVEGRGGGGVRELLSFVALYRLLAAAFRDVRDAEEGKRSTDGGIGTPRTVELLERLVGAVRRATASDAVGPAGQNAVRLCVRVSEWLVGRRGGDEEADGDRGTWTGTGASVTQP